MPTVIPVKFRYASRDLWFNPKNTGAQEADHVICSTERGTEIGIATGDAREVSDHELKEAIGNSRLSSVIRIATDRDLDLADTLARKGDDALPVFRQLVSQSGLDMKPVGVEYLFGGEKVVCYFSAEERVDFRQLVRDLSHTLHQRIDMRQIGVREEAAIVGGYGHCGQELCCRRFGLSFEPVSIRMAKEQDLPLNSSKISGACGRLMCCLRYEFEAYRDFKSRAPKRNAVIDTPLGKAKIVEYDTPKEEICLRIENGKQVRIPLSEMVASDAAKKKSQELGCPCRPDTVVRASLDKLNSPDVQMALAELDRKNGVLPPETYDDSDIFVDTKARHRRSKSRTGEGQTRGEATQPRQRRPRRNAEAEQSAATAEGHARRRHRRVAEDAPEAHGERARGQERTQDRSQQEAQAGTRRRRHHRSAEGSPSAGERARGQEKTQDRGKGNGGPQGSRSGGDRSRQQGGGNGSARHMRHPGDRGGKAAGEQQSGRTQRQGQGAGPGRSQRGGQGQAEREQRHGMRPRRHRGGNNRGHNGSPEGTGTPGGAGGSQPKS